MRKALSIPADGRKIRSSACTFDGIRFDSRTERDYYVHLLSLKRDGEITGIECHPTFVLQPPCERFGRKYQPIRYTPDFLVTYPDGRKVAVDVKGYGMEDAELKRKLFAYQHPETELRWVAQSKKYGEDGWIDYDELMKCRRAARKKAGFTALPLGKE